MTAADRLALLLGLSQTAEPDRLGDWRVDGRPLTIAEFKMLRQVTLEDFAAYRALLQLEAEVEHAAWEGR